MSSERQKARGGSQEGKRNQDSRKHVRVCINMLWLDKRLTLHSTALLEKLTIAHLGNKFHSLSLSLSLSHTHTHTHTHTHIYMHIHIHRVAHEKPACRLVDQRGRRSRTLYRKLNKCKCKILTG